MDEIILDDGKYRFYKKGSSIYCDRYGRKWREFVGDHAINALFNECIDLRCCVTVAKGLCKKFINKVETGRARSTETYAECKVLLNMIKGTEVGK